MTDYTLTIATATYTLNFRALGLTVGSIAPQRRTGRPRVPEYVPSADDHRRLIARSLNEAIAGRLDCVVDVTLTASAASTVVTDARVNRWTVALAMPRTANAAAEIGAGGMYFTPAAGTLTITHANNAQTDRVFSIALIG